MEGKTMNKLAAAMKEVSTHGMTENGMPTFTSSLKAIVDLFFMGGAYRKRSDEDVTLLFAAAMDEDPTYAIKVLGYIRDVRGGMGERKFFRTCLQYIARTNRKINVSYIPELGRWDDLFVLFNTSLSDDALSAIKQALQDGNGLCAKWMPRKGALAEKIREYLGYTPREYRKKLVELTRVVETQMCRSQWSEINYSHVPSVANVKYNKAFFRHDKDRRQAFLEAAKRGEVKINASATFPHEILWRVGRKGQNWDQAQAMWNQYPDVLEGSKVNFIPVCDVSGSMGMNGGMPMEISTSLGIYLAERSRGVFRDMIITFDSTPSFFQLSGDLQNKLNHILKAPWGGSTNIEATFRLILAAGVKHKVPQEDMPTHILIISDMEFNECTLRKDENIMTMIRRMYEEAGYVIPNIVFWNVSSRNGTVPVRFDTSGVALVSGATPAVIKAVLSGEVHPMSVIQRAVDNERYSRLLPV